MLTKKTVCIALIFIGFNFLMAQIDLFNIKSLNGYLDMSVLYLNWDPKLESFYEGEVAHDFIDYKTVGEFSMNLKTHLAYNGYSLFKMSYTLPLENTPEMKNIVEYNSKNASGLENLKIFLILDPIANALLPDKEWRVFRYFLRWRYSYYQRKFITNAHNDDAFYFIPQNAEYNDNSGYIDGIELIPADQDMIWNTEIIEHKFTLKILDFDSKSIINGETYIVPLTLRIGYFSVIQHQPALGFFSLNGTPLLMEGAFLAQGLIVEGVTINELSNGFNMDWYVKMYSGSDFNTNLIDNALYDFYKNEVNTDAWSSYLAMGFNSWWNMQLSSNLSATLGLDFEINAFYLYTPAEENGRKEEEPEPEPNLIWMLRQYPLGLYFRIGYNF